MHFQMLPLKYNCCVFGLKVISTIDATATNGKVGLQTSVHLNKLKQPNPMVFQPVISVPC